MQLVNKTTGIIEFDGPLDKFYGVTAYQHNEVNAEFEIILTAQEQRDYLRGEIAKDAGDNLSLLGTTSDTVHILLYELSRFMFKLNTAQTLAEMRSAASPINTLIGNIHKKVDDDVIQLPYQAKGIDQVIFDIENRATSVAKILTDNN